MSEAVMSYYPLFLEEKNEETGMGAISPGFWMFPRNGSGSVTAGSRIVVAINLIADSPISKAKIISSKSLETEFNELVVEWKEETASLSSLTKIYAHPAYQRIMAMGLNGIPFVLKELQKQTDHWFYALRFMAGKNVSEGITDAEDAKAAWLEWGYKNNHI